MQTFTLAFENCDGPHARQFQGMWDNCNGEHSGQSAVTLAGGLDLRDWCPGIDNLVDQQRAT